MEGQPQRRRAEVAPSDWVQVATWLIASVASIAFAVSMPTSGKVAIAVVFVGAATLASFAVWVVTKRTRWKVRFAPRPKLLVLMAVALPVLVPWWFLYPVVAAPDLRSNETLGMAAYMIWFVAGLELVELVARAFTRSAAQNGSALQLAETAR